MMKMMMMMVLMLVGGIVMANDNQDFFEQLQRDGSTFSYVDAAQRKWDCWTVGSGRTVYLVVECKKANIKQALTIELESTRSNYDRHINNLVSEGYKKSKEKVSTGGIYMDLMFRAVTSVITQDEGSKFIDVVARVYRYGSDWNVLSESVLFVEPSGSLRTTDLMK